MTKSTVEPVCASGITLHARSPRLTGLRIDCETFDRAADEFAGRVPAASGPRADRRDFTRLSAATKIVMARENGLRFSREFAKWIRNWNRGLSALTCEATKERLRLNWFRRRAPAPRRLTPQGTKRRSLQYPRRDQSRHSNSIHESAFARAPNVLPPATPATVAPSPSPSAKTR